MAYEWIIDALDETWSSIDRTLATARRSRPTTRRRRVPAGACATCSATCIGFELMLRGAPVPAHEGEWPAYVKNPIGEINEAFVAGLSR